MTAEATKQLEDHLEKSKTRLRLLSWLIEAFPKGINRTMLILAVFDIILAIMLVWVLANQASAEHIRDHRIVIIDHMAYVDSLNGSKVDKMAVIIDRLESQVADLRLHQSQAETRGAINRGTLDTIKQAVSPLLRNHIHSTLK